jgi:hypothetical protein
MKWKGRLAIALASLCLVGILGTWAWNEFNVSPLRKALPPIATEIREYEWSDGFLPDYSYHLKARIDAKAFRSYVQAFELALHRDASQYDESPVPWLNWRANGAPKDDGWWTPSESLEGTFVSNRRRRWTFAKYEDGYLYVKSLQH